MIDGALSHDLGTVRELLLAAFTAEELRRFCQDHPRFEPVLKDFGPQYNLNQMVDEVIDYCRTRDLFSQLLLAVRERNPSQYARFAPQLGIPLAEGLPEVACPYRGLEPFEAEHAEFYFGREAMVETLVDKVKDHAFVAVVGPSGCGKSSLVRAGLVTALQSRALPGSQDWAIRVFRPGPDPLRALAAPLVDLLEPEMTEVTRLRETRELADGLRDGTVPIADVAVRLREVHPNAPRLMLLADQFEELYTECPDEALRRAFVGALRAAAEEEGITVVLTLRADFYGRVLADRRLGEAVDAGLANVLPMSEAELRAAVEKPALETGRVFEPRLVERIVEDVAGEPGNLPLLEFALTELWAWQTPDGQLTHQAYEAIGQVRGAIARRAEAIYEELAKRHQAETARHVFLRLTHYGEGAGGTRRRATLDDLVTPRTPREEVEAAVKALADARLLVTGGEAETATAEVSHEALIQGWDRLRRWLDENRAFGLWRERLAALRRTWEETEQDEGAVLRGAPLAEAEGWLADRGDDLNEAERAYVETSLALREQQVVARERRRRWAVTFAVGAAVVFMILAALAGVQWRAAETSEATAVALAEAESTARTDADNSAATAVVLAEAEAAARTDADNARVTAVALAEAEAAARADAEAQRDRADLQADIALSRQLAAHSARELEAKHPELALLLAIESGRAKDTAEAFAALREAVARGVRTRLILAGHEAWVDQAWWNADGSRILTAGGDGTARVWDARTGEELLIFSGHADRVYQASWNADESRILTAGGDGTARVWDAQTGEELLTLSGHERSVYLASWNAEGSHILTGSDDATARVWDAETGEELLILRVHEYWVPTSRAVRQASWNADESRILIAGGDGTARVWDAQTGEELLILSGHVGGVNQASWNADESRILTAGDRTARVWDAETGEELLTLSEHWESVLQASWNADESRILTAGNDATARVWDAETGEDLLILRGHEGPVRQASWNADGSRILTASADGTARVWDAESWEDLLILSGHKVVRAWWNADGSRILTVGGDHTARVWDAETGEDLLILSSHKVVQAWWNADGSRILTAGGDGMAQVWDAETGEELLILAGHKVVQARWNADGSRILTAGGDGTARVWDAETGEELLFLAGHKFVQAWWNADGSRILITGGEGTARVWDAETGEELIILRGHVGFVNQASWNADGSRILADSRDRTARVWDAETGEGLLILAGHEDWVYQASWNADGSRILTAGADGTARVWDAETGEELVILRGHVGDVNQASWNADGSRILTAGDDGTARVWYARMEDSLEAACRIASRNLTREEWARYMKHEAKYRATCEDLPLLEE